MLETVRKGFLTWYETVAKKNVVKRRVTKSYCQADVTVLHERCRTFHMDFPQIGNFDDFLQTITIVSACNKTY
jgi:hypothetical protein